MQSIKCATPPIPDAPSKSYVKTGDEHIYVRL